MENQSSNVSTTDKTSPVDCERSVNPKVQKKLPEQKNIQLELITASDLQGQVLKNRYMISHPLDEGSFGNIYECVDLNKPKNIYVIKVSDNYQMLGREIQALSDLKKQEKSSEFEYPYEYVPKCAAKGMFIYDQKDQSSQQNDAIVQVNHNLIQESIKDGKQFMSFYVMQKFGRNLDSYFNQFNMKFSPKTIFQLGIKIINVLERIHSAGIIYNDMKFDNILVGNYKNNENTMHEIRMVDFGFASNYTDKAGNHLPETETEVFRSNMIFATINQFEFRNTSRRDDMMSLCYLIVFMFNQGNVPFIAPGNLSKKHVFNYIKKVKKTIKTSELIKGIDESGNFQIFTDQIFNLQFEEQPNYQYLISLLVKCLSSIGEINNNEFDWNKQWAKYEESQLIYQNKTKRGTNESQSNSSVPDLIQQIKDRNAEKIKQVQESIKNGTGPNARPDLVANNQEESKNMEDQCDLSFDEINQEEALINSYSGSKNMSTDKLEVISNKDGIIQEEESIINEQNKVHILTNQLAQLSKPTKTNFSVFNKN